MKKRTTIKDIANLAGVSLGSVHCALNGKPGVGDETRARILRTAKQLGYHPNAIAASLKRKSLKIAAVIPELSGENRFHYQAVKDGITDYVKTLQDYNVELITVSYAESETEAQVSEMNSLAARDDISGIVSVGYTPTTGIISLRKAEEKQIPTVLVGNDVPQSGRICCVLPDYLMVGKTMAEQMLNTIGKDSSILICAGSKVIPSNYLIVEGIENYLRENNATGNIFKVYGSAQSKSQSTEITDILIGQKVSGCCAVTARSSARLGNILENQTETGQIFSIGVDLFEETITYLRRGIFNNLVQNNPYKSAYLATKLLTEYLMKDIKPAMDLIHIGSEIIFKSNLPMYENGYYRMLM